MVWPLKKDSDVSHWEIADVSNTLTVYTDRVSLLQMGIADRDDFEWSIEFRQLSQTGRIGMFFGYREDLPHATGSYQLLSVLVLNENQHRLIRSTHTFPLGAPQKAHASTTLKATEITYVCRFEVRS